MAPYTTEHLRSAQLVLALGWLSLGVGLAELLAPYHVARLIGAAPTKRTARRLRFMSLREIGTGLALFRQFAGARPVWGRVRSGITIDRPIHDVYEFWRAFETFPGFMRHLEGVRRLDDWRSRWTVRGPGGTPMEWDARIVSDRADHLIQWRSQAGAEVEHQGAVRFEPAARGRGTDVHLEVSYRQATGPRSRAVGWLFGKDPRRQVREDLRRVKEILEVGDVLFADAPATSARATSESGVKELSKVR